MAVKSKTDARARRHARLRKKVIGTELRHHIVHAKTDAEGRALLRHLGFPFNADDEKA